MMEIIILLTIINSLAIVALLAGQHWHHTRIRRHEGRFAAYDAVQIAVTTMAERPSPVPFNDKEAASEHLLQRREQQRKAVAQTKRGKQ